MSPLKILPFSLNPRGNMAGYAGCIVGTVVSTVYIGLSYLPDVNPRVSLTLNTCFSVAAMGIAKYCMSVLEERQNLSGICTDMEPRIEGTVTELFTAGMTSLVISGIFAIKLSPNQAMLFV